MATKTAQTNAPLRLGSKLLSAAQIEPAKSMAIERVVEVRNVQLRAIGVERVGPCPVCGGEDRFSINVIKQVWNCRGCQKGGDAIALVRHLDGVDFIAAVETLIGRVPARKDLSPRPKLARSKSITDDYEQKQRRKAEWLWQHRQSIAGTPAEIYLREKRKYRGEIPPTLAYLPPWRPEHHPAMIAAFALVGEIEPGVLAAPNNVNSVHLTLLNDDGTKTTVNPNKLVIGRPLGRPILLAPPNDLLGLAVTEGIEDGLTALQATGLGVWVAGNAVLMPSLADSVPNYIECVTIFAHSDRAGQAGAMALAAKLDARGIEVLIEGIAA